MNQKWSELQCCSFITRYCERAKNHGAPLPPERVFLIQKTSLPSKETCFQRAGKQQKSEEDKSSSNYWSSSTNVNNSDNAWQVNFNNGNVNNNNKTNDYLVRCVSGAWLV